MINFKTSNNFKKTINIKTKKMAKYQLIFKKNINKIIIVVPYLPLQIHQVIQMNNQIIQKVLHLIIKMIDSKIRNISIKKGKIKCKTKRLKKEDF
jgi:hypothetical protein